MTPTELARGLPKQARARLKRHICYLCEARLDQGWCGAIGPRCDDQTMVRRMAACLAKSKLDVCQAAAAEMEDV